MYYKGYFRSTDTSIDADGQLYKVVIITNYNTNEVQFGEELILSDVPFVVNYDSDDNNIYKPYKCSTATVSILQKQYRPDFNNTKANNVLVKLLKFKNGRTEDSYLYEGDGKHHKDIFVDDICWDIEWIGFATPNAYSQPYENFYDEFNLECQDVLSTLKYMKFEYEENSMISFMNIIRKCPIYSEFIISDSLFIPTSNNKNILEMLYVNQMNFFDEDGESWNYLEIIEEIGKYLCLTFIPYKDKLWVLDYNAIKNGYNKYWRISATTQQIAQYNDEYEILEKSFKSTGTNLSVNSIYNRVIVKDDFYPIDDKVTGDLDDKTRWEHVGIYDKTGKYDNFNYIVSADKITNGTIDQRNIKDLTVIQNSRLGSEKYQFIYIEFLKYNKSKNISDKSELICYNYAPDIRQTGGSWMSGVASLYPIYTYDFLRNQMGAMFIAYDVYEFDVSGHSDYNRDPLPTKIDLKPAILVNMPTDYNGVININSSNWPKVIEYKSGILNIGYNDFFVLNGTFRFHYNDDCLPITEPNNDEDKANSQLEFTLEFNNKFWDNASKTWVDNKIKSQTSLITDINVNKRFANDRAKAWNTDVHFIDNFNYKDLLDIDRGLVIPVPSINEGDVDSGQVILTIYRPVMNSTNRTAKSVLITDLEIKVTSSSLINSPTYNEDNTNTEYIGEMEEEAIDEYDNIDLKITTWDNKQPNYSSVSYKDVDSFKRLNVFMSKSTGEILKAEEHICNNIVRQYTEPTLKLNLNLKYKPEPYTIFKYKFFNDKIFVFDGGEFDYGNNKYNITITEKK